MKFINIDKTTMLKCSVERYRKNFEKRHEESLMADVNSLSVAINANFPDEKVTVWHCCTRNGHGYYTISNGEKKRFVHSKYELERVGGVWSLHVYERLYMGQVHLMKFLKAVKAEICSKFAVEMPLKTLYIAYILDDLGKWEDTCKKVDCYYKEDKREFEIARKYQHEFTENYAEEIKSYSKILAHGGNFWSYYNGAENDEYSCVSDILENAINEIYQNREQLEACELWEQARKVIDTINNIENWS